MTLLKTSEHFHTLATESYSQLLQEKHERLQSLLKPFVNETAKISVFDSPKSNFRMRAEFGIWHEGDDCCYTMIHKDAEGNRERFRVEKFPVACEAINELMPKLLQAVKQHPLLKQKLFQVEFLSTLSADMLVTLIYHKPLDEQWQALAKNLEKQFRCSIIGRSRKQKCVLSKDYVLEKLTVLDTQYTYKQLEGGFTQPNAFVCEKMLAWACEKADSIKSDKDMLELYCGNGNFTLPLSKYFRHVLATEISKTSVAAAEFNIETNNIDNIKIARLSAEEFTEAQKQEREFRRLKQANITLADYEFSTVFVDPPRAGIDDETLKLLAQFDNIIYISCNPETLADNLQTLTKTHTVVDQALFDQFPYTHHIEAGVFLQKS